jgi:hypothetical protein
LIFCNTVTIRGMREITSSGFAFLVMLLVFPGCGNQAEPPAETEIYATFKAVTAYPLTKRMMLGEFQAQIKPLISIPVVASSDGDIQFHVSTTRLMLDQDVLWGEIGAEQIASEERELELKTGAEKLRLREDLQKVKREIEQVEYMLAEPALLELPFEDRIMVSTNLLQRLRNEYRLLEEQLATCGEAERFGMEQKNLRSRFVMPFAGEVLIYLPVSPSRKRFRVAANTPIGIMRDMSELYLHIVIRDPAMVGIPPEQLFVEYKRDSGRVYIGTFHDAQMTELQKQDVLIYRFAFSPAHTAELGNLIGANLTCGLWVQADREFHSVPKLEVARMLDGKRGFPGWGEVVQELWPTARLLYTGRSHLGIAMENTVK